MRKLIDNAPGILLLILLLLVAAHFTFADNPDNEFARTGALTEAQVCHLAEAHGGGIPPALLVAQMFEESGWQVDVVSSADAVGLMQIVQKFHPGVDLVDAITNVEVGAHVLASDFYYLNHMRGGLSPDTPIADYGWDNPTYTTRALWGYVMGSGNVTWYDQHPDREPPAEVQGYSQNILSLRDRQGYCQEAA